MRYDVSQKQLDGIRDGINKLDDGVKKVVMDVIDRVGISDYEALRDALVAEFLPTMRNAYSLAEELAMSCYNAWRTLQLGSGIADFSSSVKTTFDEGSVLACINTAVKSARTGGTVDNVVNILTQNAGYSSRKAYSQMLFNLGSVDTKKPRYARVPGGGETCDFCLMLASNGFVYRKGKEGEKVHNHANCDCTYAVSWSKSPTVQNYSEKDCYNRWQDSIDSMATERAERNGTTYEAEREKIMDKYKQASKKAKARNK